MNSYLLLKCFSFTTTNYRGAMYRLREVSTWFSCVFESVKVQLAEIRNQDIPFFDPRRKWIQLMDKKWICFTITGATITNAYIFRNVSMVTLVGCDSLHDVSALANAYTVTLISCPRISDVSTLNKVRNLHIRDCRGITDVSALSAADCLGLIELNVDDVSKLGGVDSLIFIECHNITDISMLRNVNNLIIHKCNGITDISSLVNLSGLCVSECPNVKDTSKLIPAEMVVIKN